MMYLKKDNYYIARVLEGKISDYACLIDKYKDMIFTLAFRITGNREDAEEVAQDAFLKDSAALPGFPHGFIKLPTTSLFHTSEKRGRISYHMILWQEGLMNYRVRWK